MRLQTQDKTTELQKKFPGIKAAVARLQENGADVTHDRFYISVERVDQAVLCNVPVLCSGKGASLRDPNMPGLLGRQHDVFFAVGNSSEILGHIGALAPEDKLRDERPVKHLILSHRNQVSYLVRVTITIWCDRLSDPRDKDSPMGEVSHRDIAVTVYREPDEGFDALLTRTWTDENLRLHFVSIFGFGNWVKNPDVHYFLNQIFPLVKEFQEKTFFNGFIDSLPANTEGDDGKGQLGEVSYDASNWEDRNKVRIRLSRGDVFVQFFYNGNHGKWLSVEGMDATLEEARQLLHAANVGWVRKQIGEDKLQELKQMWEAACTHVSTDYTIRLVDNSVDLRSTVPGIIIEVQDGDCCFVTVPVESEASFQSLIEQGKVQEPTDEQLIRLLELYYEAQDRRVNTRWGGPQGVERTLRLQELERLRAKIAKLREKTKSAN